MKNLAVPFVQITLHTKFIFDDQVYTRLPCISTRTGEYNAYDLGSSTLATIDASSRVIPAGGRITDFVTLVRINGYLILPLEGEYYDRETGKLITGVLHAGKGNGVYFGPLPTPSRKVAELSTALY